MRKSTSAIILFTLSPSVESKRKPLGLCRRESAASVFAAFVGHLERVCCGLPDIDLLVTTPGTSAHHLPQRGSDFGDCLRAAVEDAFSMSYERVVVIGNDAPEISPSYIQRAFERLGSKRSAVIGPARDGGYALLGLSAPCPRAFESMPWGSSLVARVTEERLEASGFTVERLATLEDIDDLRGLARFFARARREDLRALAKRVSTFLSQAFPQEVCRLLSLPDIIFVGWRGLRAPPASMS